jgi:hypothetical protein
MSGFNSAAFFEVGSDLPNVLIIEVGSDLPNVLIIM